MQGYKNGDAQLAKTTPERQLTSAAVLQGENGKRNGPTTQAWRQAGNTDQQGEMCVS